MIGSEIKTFAEGLLNGETIDTDLFYQLLTDSKDEVEGDHDWEMLKREDGSQAASAAAKNLPATFRSPISLLVGTLPYQQVPFEQKRLFSSSGNCWYLDFRNSQYYLTGNPPGGTIYLYFIYQTDDLTSANSPVWPARFHKLLGYMVAKKWFWIEGEERGLSYDDKWDQMEKIIRRSMLDWDAKLQKRAIENASPMDEIPGVDLGMM